MKLLLLLGGGGGGRGGLGLRGKVAREERRPEGGVKREASEAAGGDGEAAEVAEPQRGRRGAQLQDARPKLVRKIRRRHALHPLGLGGERWSANTATARRLGERGGTEESYAVAQAPPPLPLSWTCEFRIPRRTRGIRNTQKERERPSWSLLLGPPMDAPFSLSSANNSLVFANSSSDRLQNKK